MDKQLPQIAVPSATWFRFRRAAQESDAIFLLLTQVACARSSALCVLDCSVGIASSSQNVLSGLSRSVEVARQRLSSPFAKKAPGRATTWEANACLDACGGEITVGYAAIYIPEFPSLAWLRLEASARSRAIAVVEGSAPLERIVSFNRASKELGLEHGMSKVQADTSGQILFHTRSNAEEQAALDVVFEVTERLSPRVQIIASPVNQYARSKQSFLVGAVSGGGCGPLYHPPLF